MQKTLLELKEIALEHLANAASLSELNELKVKYLGKKGGLTEIMKGMGKLSPESDH